MVAGRRSRRGRCRRAVWLVGGLLIVPVAGGVAQDDEVRRDGIFIDSIDVSLVNVEVRVTRDGEPVTDLTADDFEILDDGEPVEITNFYRVAGGRRVASVQAEEEAELAALPEPEQPAATAPPQPVVVERSSVLVLVDQPFLSVPSRKLVFEQLSQQLDRLTSQGTRVMVVSKNRDVVIEQTLTADREEIEVALDRLARVAASDWSSEIRRVIEASERRPQASESRQTGPGQSSSISITSVSDAQAAYQETRRLSQQMQSEVRYSLALLRRFVGSLAGMPGRKALLYVADRLPVRPGEQAWRIWWARYGFEHGARFGATSVDAVLIEYDASADFREVVADANANKVSFYPIGVGTGPNLAGAESRGVSLKTHLAGTLASSQDGRRWLASGTGGQVAVGRGSFEHFFELLQQDLAHYYSLAFPSRHRGDGKTHDLEVRVRRPDVEVRYLAEYRDKSPDQQMTERTLASLILGVGENPLGVRVEVGKIHKDTQDLYRVPVEIRVPVADLVLLPGKTSHLGKLSIQVVARDEQGRLSDPVTVRMPIEIPHQAMLQALSESAVYPAELLMRRGRQTIAVGVHDDLGATGSTIRVSVDVGGRG